MRDTAPAVTMLTFGPMIDSETARRLLRLYQVPFVEERHLFGWASVLSLVRAGTVRIPVVIGPGRPLSGSRAVADHFEPAAPRDRKLLPDDPDLRSQVEADWAAFNGQLAGPVAVVAYYHLLPQTQPMIAAFSEGVAPGEAARTAQWYGLLRWLFTVLLQLNPAHAAQALARVRQAVDAVERRLADGRSFLVGGQLSLSDVSFACALAPLALPAAYSAPVPRFDQMPPGLQTIVAEMRRRPVFGYIDRIYALMDARSPPAAGP